MWTERDNQTSVTLHAVTRHISEWIIDCYKVAGNGSDKDALCISKAQFNQNLWSVKSENINDGNLGMNFLSCSGTSMRVMPWFWYSFLKRLMFSYVKIQQWFLRTRERKRWLSAHFPLCVIILTWQVAWHFYSSCIRSSQQLCDIWLYIWGQLYV